VVLEEGEKSEGGLWCLSGWREGGKEGGKEGGREGGRVICLPVSSFKGQRWC